MKTCTKCGSQGPFSFRSKFYKRSQLEVSKPQAWCIECMNEYNRRKLDAEKVKLTRLLLSGQAPEKEV